MDFDIKKIYRNNRNRACDKQKTRKKKEKK